LRTLELRSRNWPDQPPAYSSGEGVSSPVPGTRVAALVIRGGYAEYAVAPQTLVYPLPSQVDFAAAVAYLVQGITAWAILRDSGAGGVGTLAIQLAKVFGASTVIPTARKPPRLTEPSAAATRPARSS